jgi:hypothetical protein
MPLILQLKAQGYHEQDFIHEFSFCGYGKLRKIDDHHWATPYSHYSQSIYLHGQPMPMTAWLSKNLSYEKF